jgi:hypothetical protein
MPDTSNLRALLASPGFESQPVKGVYFFPGEAAGNLDLYTVHPLLTDDRRWNSDPSSRGRVMDRLVAAHVNTIVMSYWSIMPQWSPMLLDAGSLAGVLNAAEKRALVILPAIESGFAEDQSIPQWKFARDFPSPTHGGPLAPGLIARVSELITLFRDRMHQWARLFDRNGVARYSVQILHAYSELRGTTDQQFADAFGAVAAEVRKRFQIEIGFVLDLVGGDHPYIAKPPQAGPVLEREATVLAANGFASEVFSGRVIAGPPCGDPDWRRCQPFDNNRENLPNLADWKRDAVRDWAVTGLPVILDVTNGMDGRIVWRKVGVGFWGDNMNYTEDRWRNWMSQLKGPAIRGITVDTWNGYTEGWAVTPSFEHGETGYHWLTDLLEPDPRHYSHMHYVNGARTFRVFGAICLKWLQLGADRGFGVPVTEELPSARGRVSFFVDTAARKAIYWSGATGAHEVHGVIAQTYWEVGADADPLGLPISDEEPLGAGRVSRFEGGRIEWSPGDLRGRIVRN